MTRYAYTPLGRFPAPFVHVTLRNPRSGEETVDLPAQVDPGADRTVIPSSAIQTLGLLQLDEIPVGGLEGTVVTLPTFVVQLTVRHQTPLLLEVIGGRNEKWILLGRDVLNCYRIVLDGPRLGLEIE